MGYVMTRKTTAQAKFGDHRGCRSRSAAADRRLRALVVLAGIGTTIACGFIAGMGESGAGQTSESVSRNAVRPGDPRSTAGLTTQGPANALDVLQRLPESLRATLLASKTLSVKDLCRVADGLVREPTVTNVDTVAHYLSKDVHRWSDRMIALYLDDPKLVKAADKNEMKKRLLQKWESDRAMAQRWLQGCGVVVRGAIGRSRPAIEREAPELLADVVSVIAIGLRKNEPDAMAAAQALARTEGDLRAFLK
jgi:hypothetical protein